MEETIRVSEIRTEVPLQRFLDRTFLRFHIYLVQVVETRSQRKKAKFVFKYQMRRW